MKQKVLFAVLACGLFAVCAPATVSAQIPGTAIRVSIPFDFNVRGKVLPQGEYMIKRVSDRPDVLEIQNVGRLDHEKAVFTTEAFSVRRAPGKGEIIFHKYGDEYFLSRVLAGGEQTGRELPLSRQERTLKRETVGSYHASQPETVTLAAN